jgi:hypothetical protein
MQAYNTLFFEETEGARPLMTFYFIINKRQRIQQRKENKV